MAEFCKECFEKLFAEYLKDNDELVISEYNDLCEGCGKVIPIVEQVTNKKYNDIFKCLKGMKIKCINGSFEFLTKNKIYEILDYQYVTGWHMFLIKGDNGNQGWCQEFNFEISVDKLQEETIKTWNKKI